MSTDVIDEVVDDVEMVDAELEAQRDEQENQELVDEVDAFLKKDEQETTTGDKPSKEAAEAEDGTPDDLNQATKDRASDAGISGDLAERLHKQGLLEEMLAATDRKAIERLEKKGPPEKAKEGKEPDTSDDTDDQSSLDPELFDEQLVKRDLANQKRFERLESMLERVLGGFEQQSSSQVQSWFRNSTQSAGDLNADETIELEDGYRRICEAYGVEPANCDEQMLQRAYAALFPDKVFKKAQRDTVDRLRDAEGKFINSNRSGGSPPEKKQHLTEDEITEELVAEVDAYLKTGKKA